MRSLILWCTKNARFSFNNNIYKQIDVAGICSPLGPVMAAKKYNGSNIT